MICIVTVKQPTECNDYYPNHWHNFVKHGYLCERASMGTADELVH
jgi:hypothetical protein